MSDEVIQSKYELDVSDYIESIVKATLETQKLLNKTEDVGKETEKVKDKSKTSWTIVAVGINQALEIGKKFIDVMAGVVNKLLEFRDAADDHADAIAGMNLQLKNMGIYTDNLSDKLIKNAEALEKNSNYQTTSILEGTKMLLTYNNLGEDVLPAATQAMLDMSAVMKMDLSSAAQTIGKALQDPVTGLGLLSKQGFHFTEQQKAMIEEMVKANNVLGAQNIVLDEINLAFGGHAALQKDSIDQLKNSWISFKEVLGTVAQPAVDTLADILSTFNTNMTFLIKYYQDSKKIKSGDVTEVTKDDLGLHLSNLKREIEASKKELEMLNTVPDAYKDNTLIAKIEKEIELKDKLISKIEKELKYREIKSKDQDVINAKIKKETEEAAARAEAEKARLKDIEDRRQKRVKDRGSKTYSDTYGSIYSEGGIEKTQAQIVEGNVDYEISQEKITKDANEKLKKTPKKYVDPMSRFGDGEEDYQIKVETSGYEAKKDIKSSIEKEKQEYEKQYNAYYKHIERIQKLAEKEREQKERAVKRIEKLNERMAKSYEDVRDVSTQAIEDVLLSEQKSLGEYALILSDQLAQKLAHISAEATVESLWETAQGIAALAATGGVPTTKSTGHFAAAAAYGQTATAAGLGAFAAASASRGLHGAGYGNDENSNNSSSSATNTETELIQTASAKALEDKETIYISTNDWKKMAFYNIDAINEALASGKSLKLKK